MLAPLGLVAATTGSAGAAPTDGLPLVVSGDVVTRNLVAPASPNWTWATPTTPSSSALFAAYNVGGVTFDTTSVPSIASPTYDPATKTGSLANVDVYVSGGVGGGVDGPDAGTTVDYEETGYSAAEERALLAWVRDGGVLIAQTNSKAFDDTRFLGDSPDTGDFVDVQEPVAYYDTASGAHGCLDMPGNDGCAGGQVQAPPVGAVVNAASAIGAGVGTIRNWHTVTLLPRRHAAEQRGVRRDALVHLPVADGCLLHRWVGWSACRAHDVQQQHRLQQDGRRPRRSTPSSARVPWCSHPTWTRSATTTRRAPGR